MSTTTLIAPRADWNLAGAPGPGRGAIAAVWRIIAHEGAQNGRQREKRYDAPQVRG